MHTTASTVIVLGRDSMHTVWYCSEVDLCGLFPERAGVPRDLNFDHENQNISLRLQVRLSILPDYTLSVKMAQNSGKQDLKTQAALYQLEQPEKPKAIMKEMDYDCLSCRVMGKQCLLDPLEWYSRLTPSQERRRS